MKFSYIVTLVSLISTPIIEGCTSKSADTQTIEALDSERIITIGGTITEIVCALEACDQIVATDRTSTEAFTNLDTRPEGRYFTFRYVVQPDGSNSF